MSDTQKIFERQLQRLQLEEQAATADYNSHLYNHDEDAAGEAMMQIADARNRRNVLVSEYQADVARNQYRAPYVSEEARAARRPEEMDQEDMARVMNTSRYSGGKFTSQDYDALRRGLGWYKTSRGLESK
jgi:hypothetical protein